LIPESRHFDARLGSTDHHSFFALSTDFSFFFESNRVINGSFAGDSGVGWLNLSAAVENFQN
jgi:hypothetical protein